MIIDTKSKWSVEEPTAHLRWNAGTLEQQWRITSHEDRIVVDIRGEWRPIPCAIICNTTP